MTSDSGSGSCRSSSSDNYAYSNNIVTTRKLSENANLLHHNSQQELSYRKQIARQLCTQYVEGIYTYSNLVTLKSSLGVTGKVIENSNIR